MAASPTASTEKELRAAQEEVLSHLRSKNAAFLPNVGISAIPKHRGEIAAAFLDWLKSTPFALEVVALENSTPLFEGRWTHNGAAFVGFKQPPAASNRDDAAILACAALLHNEWCRARLPA